MTPPAAATVAGRAPARRSTAGATRVPRRVSGPARRVPHGSVALDTGGLLAQGLALRLARRLATLPDARLLDRLIRGRLWIGILAVGLIGIVFFQISLLKLNTGIGRAVQTAQTLDQQNDSMRAELSRMAGGARIQDRAGALGYVLPAVGQPRFLDARGVSAARAAAAITTPDPVEQLPLGMIPPGQGGTAGLTPVAAPATAVGAVAATPSTAGTAVAVAPTATATATPVVATTTAATPATASPAPAAATAATPAVAAPATPAAAAPVVARTAAPATAGGLAAPKG